MTVAPIIKKVPGKPVKFQQEKDGYVDLTASSKIELLDLLEREKKLLNNIKFIEKLPDKGEKIKKLYNRVENELKIREENEKLCLLLSNLNVNESKSALNNLEWTGENKPVLKNIKEDDDSNPLKILATHSGTSISRKRVVRNEEYKPLIKSSDLTLNNLSNVDVDPYAKELCHRFDKLETNEKNKFYPNKSLNKTFVKSSPRTKEPESSSAYVPKNISGKAKMLSLEESIIIHQEQMKQLKEIEMTRTVEKLMQKIKIKMKQPIHMIHDYREQYGEDSDDESSITTCENSEKEDEEDRSSVYCSANDD